MWRSVCFRITLGSRALNGQTLHFSGFSPGNEGNLVNPRKGAEKESRPPTCVLPHVDQPSGLIRRPFATDVAPVGDDLVVPLHVLGQRLGVGKHIQADHARLLGVPARPHRRLFLAVQVAQRVPPQLAVVGKDLRTGHAGESLVAAVLLQVLEDLHRVLRLERANGTREEVHVDVMDLPQVHAALPPPLLLLAAVTALEVADVRVGAVAFQVNVSSLGCLELVCAALDRAPVDGLFRQPRLEIGQ